MRTVLLALSLMACAADIEPASTWELAPADGSSARVPNYFGGCGDVQLYIRNAADTRAIMLSLPDLATQAVQQGTIVQTTVTLPAPGYYVTMQRGRYLTNYSCVGAQPPNAPQVDATAAASAGTLEITVTPQPGATPGLPIANIEVDMDGVQFTAPNGQLLPTPLIELPAMTVGLYPP
jgi:hypothetical protein